eukprot:9745-Heterococcus_DN1.PRE.2
MAICSTPCALQIPCTSEYYRATLECTLCYGGCSTPRTHSTTAAAARLQLVHTALTRTTA